MACSEGVVKTVKRKAFGGADPGLLQAVGPSALVVVVVLPGLLELVPQPPYPVVVARGQPVATGERGRRGTQKLRGLLLTERPAVLGTERWTRKPFHEGGKKNT